MPAEWRIAVDIGGTFTDLAAWREGSRELKRAKVLTVPDEPARGVLQAVDKAEIRLADAVMFLHGSTVAINAVLQETGAKTALITTHGFRDVLEMGRKNRPDMYNLFFQPPPCPVPRERRFELVERMSALGEVVTPLDGEDLRALIRRLPADVQAVAVCLIHAYANPEHERRVEAAVRELREDVYPSVSTDLSGEAREYERTCTAVANAYVGPLVSTYIGRLASHLRESGSSAPLLITQSNGGVMTGDTAMRQPVRTMESGPAAGVTGAAWLGGLLKLDDLIAFDMGGTSAKACVVQHGEPESASEYHVGGRRGGLPVQVPFLEIVEVGAGGGSVAYADASNALRVGPRSAGSVPGPAAYGLGGSEPTITDANVVAGRIDPAYFLGGEMRLRDELARRAVASLAQRLGMEVDACAAGIIEVADAIMAGAIRAVTVERGRDPRDFTLVAYGGAGPLHATSLAADLAIPRVLIPLGPGTQGAFGMLVTDIRHDSARTVHRRLDALERDEMEAIFAALEEEAGRYVRAELAGTSGGNAQYVRRMDLRYVGQFHPLTLTLPATGIEPPSIPELFHGAHLERYGHNAEAEPVEATAFRVTALLPIQKPPVGRDRAAMRAVKNGHEVARRVMFGRGRWIDAAVHRRSALAGGATVQGPAVIEDVDTNVVLRPEDRATVLDDGELLIEVGAA